MGVCVTELKSCNFQVISKTRVQRSVLGVDEKHLFIALSFMYNFFIFLIEIKIKVDGVTSMRRCGVKLTKILSAYNAKKLHFCFGTHSLLPIDSLLLSITGNPHFALSYSRRKP